MFVLVSCDVNTETKEGRRRLRRIAKVCVSHGQRVQFSVFECLVDAAQWTVLRARLLDEMNPETDSLRFCFLGNRWRGRVEHVGAKPTLDQEGPLVF